jgi:hypothetical protein
MANDGGLFFSAQTPDELDQNLPRRIFGMGGRQHGAKGIEKNQLSVGYQGRR